MKSGFQLVCILLIGFVINKTNAQNPDDILFSVGDMDVTVGEFKYIYEKNNGETTSYARDSIMNYLDLYKEFKMKVKAALDMQLDTIPSLKKELQGYIDLLSKSYLIDKEIINKIAREEFERMQEDRKISHIFVKITRNDTTSAYNKIKKAYDAIQGGVSFQEAVTQFSEDKNTRNKQGVIGYVTAPFNDGFYPMENAVYNLKVGEISKIIRSSAGYHIVKLLDIRPARGTMEAAQIFVAKPENGNAALIARARQKIEQAYEALESGMKFSTVVRKYSEDKEHLKHGGYIGRFGVNTYSREFEDAAFSIKKDSAYSGIIETDIGFHIIKRISRKNPTQESFSDRKADLIRVVKNTERYEIAFNKLINSILKDADYKVYENNLAEYISSLDSAFLEYTWKPDENPHKLIVYKDNNLTFTVDDFNSFLLKNSRKRLNLSHTNTIEEAVHTLFNQFKRHTALKYEESNLIEKYPDFKYLMREYKEGILLFEITKRKVWDKASEDTVGLKKFFENHRDNYRWKKRALIHEFTFKNINKFQVKGIIDYVGMHNSEEIVDKYGTDVVSYRSYKIEKGTSRDNFQWVKDNTYDILKKKEGDLLTFKKVVDIIPPQQKTLDESKGYVISDYQELLEEKWIDKLEDKYPYDLHKRTLRKLIE